MTLPPGPIRLGPLVLTRPIGQGGMGTVWHARHPEGVDVAVKVLRPEYAADAELMDTFRREVRSVGSLDHPNLVRVYDYGAVPARVAEASADQLLPNSPWLAMEFASGGTLADLPPAEQWDTVVDLAGQVLEGLAHSHARDIVHRDLKPRNVLLHPPSSERDEEDTLITDPHQRNRLRVTVTDFGIAHALTRRSSDHAQAGTPGYMAPEQIRGEWRDQGPWTDLYALGCLAWRLVTGRSPFGGDSKRQVLHAQLDGRTEPLEGSFTLPDGAEAWLRRMIEIDPRDRFVSAADAHHALRSVAAPPAEAALPYPAQPDDWRAPYPPTTVRPAGTGLALFLLRPWPLVGRDLLQDQLWRRLRAVRDGGRAQCVVLTGPEGVGKSRLARWLAERAAETGAARVLRVQHDPEGTRSLRTALRAQLGLQDLDEDGTVRRLFDWLGHGLESTDAPPLDATIDDARALAQLLEPPPDRDPDLTEIEADPGMWLAILDRLAGGRPLVLVIDDLQWSDAAPLLASLAGSARPVLAVVTYDPARVAPARRTRIERLLEVASTVEVAPLRSKELRRLVDEGVGVSPRLAEYLVERIGGNPAMAVRLVTDWARRGMLVPTTTGFDLREGADVRLPEALAAQLGRSLEALTEEEHVAVEILATLGGRRIRDEEWAAVCHQAGIRFDDAVRKRLGATVARSHRERNVVRWTLDPLLLREAAMEQAAAAGRGRAHHDAAARVLMSTRRTSAQERAIVHLVDAGHPSAALKALRTMIDGLNDDPERQAALMAIEVRLLDAMHVSRDDPRRLPARLDALHQEGRSVPLGELRALTAKVEASGDASLCARVHRQVVERLDAALRLQAGDPLLADAERWQRVADDPAGLVSVRTSRGAARWRGGDAAGAEQELEEALEDAQRRGIEAGRAARVLGEIRARRGDPSGATLLEQAAATASADDDVAGLASVEIARSRVARAQGDLIVALDRARRASKLLVDGLRETAAADLQIGLCRLARGELTQARAELQAVVDAEVPGTSVLAQGALLSTLATPPDWQPWDQTMAAWRTHAKEGALIEPDSAWPLEWAAKRAVDAGAFARGLEAYELAAHQYALVGDQEGLTRVRRRLRSLTSAAPS